MKNIIFITLLLSLFIAVGMVSGYQANLTTNVSAGASSNLSGGQVNMSSATSANTNASVNASTNNRTSNTSPKNPRINISSKFHPQAVLYNNLPNKTSIKARREIKIMNCVMDMKERFSLRYPAAEYRYICIHRLGFQNQTKGREAMTQAWSCMANLTVNTNKTYAQIRQECYSNWLNKTLSSDIKNKSEFKARINATSEHPELRRLLIAKLIKNKKLAAGVLNDEEIAPGLVNGTNFTNKAEVKAFLKSKVMRRALLARLKSRKDLLKNKTVLAAFLPDNLNLNKTKIEEIKLPNNDTIVVRVSVKARFLGLIPAHYSQEITNNGTIKVKRPFWAFLMVNK